MTGSPRARSVQEAQTTTSPYKRVLPRDAETDVDPLELRLDFHHESVILHEYASGVTSSRLVSALDVAHALARELDLSTGLLPAEALWYTKTSAGSRLAIWRPAQVWTMRLREQYGHRPRRFRLPMPGLVFVCLATGQAPYVFAAASRPRSLDDRLYHCPTFNVFRDGRVCPGTHLFPRDASRIPEDFFRSHFSPTGDSRGRSHRHPENLLALWTELDGAREFPLDDLVPAISIADALRVGT
jgi:PRTRC genetic system protein B